MIKPAETDGQFLKNLRRMGFVEGVSTLILFGVAMPLIFNFAGNKTEAEVVLVHLLKSVTVTVYVPCNKF